MKYMNVTNYVTKWNTCLNYVKRNNSTSVKTKWQSVVGLEVHAQLNTESKLFSGAQNTFGGLVNNCVSLFDAAIPGTLPVLNRKCVELGVLTALALSCKVNEVSSFDRKHYFYADLPAGYQITQQRAPLANDGVINFQDGEEAAALVKELVLIVQKLGACSGRMEEGALRVDANVSLRKFGEPLSTRTEIKNIGSIRGVAGAVRHEIERQRTILDNGGHIINETRSWDATNKVTIAMRDKEVVQDYRYMPEPNLPPLRVNLHTKEDTQDVISVPLIKETIPELPEDSRRKLIEEYDLREISAIQLVNEPALLNYFYELVSDVTRNPTKVANLLLNDLLTVLNKRKVDVEYCTITVNQMKESTDALLNKQINLDIYRKLLDELFDRPIDFSVLEIIKEKGWTLESDETVIEQKCKEVLDNNPKLVKKYKEGKVKILNSLLGILAKTTSNKMDMAVATKKMEELLKK
ncbi:Aspartyl/glutamyl-tRNA(Asn/Gln) amidotransferase subunit B [Papilio xuthus]|uniref:Glutamyl-tRNA(Gln) amidotransferase subunit B, mitochondrial n=1 Tax=Papilio xuthus TaxID=66420 RepID=A0A194QJP0_PAPXU|nr:Aspartyl/glutamyl-tRNA(Asn/Gln) amidotransferase subunit B [Papilio xuthus]